MNRNVLIILALFVIFFVVSFIALSLLGNQGGGVTLGIKAYGRSSNPLAGAKVDLYSISLEGEPQLTFIATKYTGDDGIANFENIPVSGVIQAVITKEGYARADRNITELDKRSGLIEVNLKELTSISVDVYENPSSEYGTKPVSGVEVKAYLVDELLGVNYTDESGRAIIRNVPVYSYIRLKLSKEGYNSEESSVYAYWGGSSEKVYLVRITPAVKPTVSALHVTVRDADGYISGAKIEVYSQNGVSRNRVGIAYTDSNGKADFGSIAFENGVISVSRDGYITNNVFLNSFTVDAYGNVLVYLDREGLRVNVMSEDRYVLPNSTVALFDYVDGYGFRYIKTEHTNPSGTAGFGWLTFDKNVISPSRKGKKLEVSSVGYLTETVYVYANTAYYALLTKQTTHNGNWRLDMVVRECSGDDFSKMPILEGVKVDVYNRTENYGYELLKEAYTNSDGDANFGMVDIKAGKIVLSKEGYETDIEDLPYFESRPVDVGGWGVCLNATARG